jgi:Ca2+-binding RTX toxin-like protein
LTSLKEPVIDHTYIQVITTEGGVNMTTLTITNADWEALEGVLASAVTVESVTGSLITVNATFGDGRVAEFLISGTWTGVSGTSLAGLTGSVSGIALNVDGVSQFAATGLALDVSEITEDIFDDLADLVELALGDGVEIEGSDDDDTLSCTVGDDTVDGNLGDDDLFGDIGDDSLSGGDGEDSLDGGDGDDSLNGGIGDDSLHGGSGHDRIDAGSGNDGVTGDLGSDRLIGGGGADRLDGGGGADNLAGGSGNDRLTAGVGTDTLSGGSGNDIYEVDSVDDLIVEVEDRGIDTEVASCSDTLADNIENLVLTGSAALNGTGNAAANVITGSVGANILSGGLGDDDLRGNGGADSLSGGSGADDLAGGSGDDRLYADAGNDILNGGTGSDVLSGGRGHDRLRGGEGADSFRLQSRSGTDSDAILDFSSADDTIQLENSVFTALGSTATGALGAGNFVANASGAAVDANDFIVYETDTGRVFYDADGSGAGAAVVIAVVGTGSALTAADFTLI